MTQRPPSDCFCLSIYQLCSLDGKIPAYILDALGRFDGACFNTATVGAGDPLRRRSEKITAPTFKRYPWVHVKVYFYLTSHTPRTVYSLLNTTSSDCSMSSSDMTDVSLTHRGTHFGLYYELIPSLSDLYPDGMCLPEQSRLYYPQGSKGRSRTASQRIQIA